MIGLSNRPFYAVFTLPPTWNFIIQMKRLKLMTPLLESVLSEVTQQKQEARLEQPVNQQALDGRSS
jgi:hypothetical protein